MKKSAIAILELGLLGGIVLAAYTLPARTPLWVFLAGSAAWLVAGNVFLIRAIKEAKNRKIAGQDGPWPHLIRACVILVIAWLLALLASRGY
ncbi:MAG TPA: hypothetical protein VNJ52_07730 [Patescibacteria group bacterium]|nr:hypothetical protein [Patescibacteria group bacterium]